MMASSILPTTVVAGPSLEKATYTPSPTTRNSSQKRLQKSKIFSQTASPPLSQTNSSSFWPIPTSGFVSVLNSLSLITTSSRFLYSKKQSSPTNHSCAESTVFGGLVSLVRKTLPHLTHLLGSLATRKWKLGPTLLVHLAITANTLPHFERL